VGEQRDDEADALSDYRMQQEDVQRMVSEYRELVPRVVRLGHVISAVQRARGVVAVEGYEPGLISVAEGGRMLRQHRAMAAYAQVLLERILCAGGKP
jgi:hypothetical protein